MHKSVTHVKKQSTTNTGYKRQDKLALPQVSRSLPIALMRARENVMMPIRAMLAGSGITEQQWRVLRVLSERGPQDSGNLAEGACLLLPSVTRIVQGMLDKKLVSRSTDTTDRRRQVISITVAGQQIIDKHLGEATAISQRFIDVLGPKQFDVLLDALHQLDELKRDDHL